MTPDCTDPQRGVSFIRPQSLLSSIVKRRAYVVPFSTVVAAPAVTQISIYSSGDVGIDIGLDAAATANYEFPAGSTAPKVATAQTFAADTTARALIGAPKDIEDIIANTHVDSEAPGVIEAPR